MNAHTGKGLTKFSHRFMSLRNFPGGQNGIEIHIDSCHYVISLGVKMGLKFIDSCHYVISLGVKIMAACAGCSCLERAT